MTMKTNSLDFTKVEALRRHMLLTVAQMAELFGVSRMTYYSWLKGNPIRSANERNVRAMLKKLLVVVTEHNWPTPEIVAATPQQRMEALLKLLNK